MKGWKLLCLSLGAVVVFVLAVPDFLRAQTAQNRIPQQIIINGQHFSAVYVTAPGGGMQSFTCSSPQQYTTPDGASQGWACYDQAAGVWLLNAVPPAAPPAPPVPVPTPAPAQSQPTVIYQQPPTVIYQQPPSVVYTAPAYPVVVAPAYPSSVVLGAAVINATGRIVSAAVFGSRYYYPLDYYYPQRGVSVRFRGRRW